MVDDYRLSVREGLDGMTGIAGYDRNEACSRDLGDAVDGHLKLAFDHLVDLFLGMKMLVNGGTAREVVVREGHIGRVEIASVPTRQSLDDRKALGVHEGH